MSGAKQPPAALNTDALDRAAADMRKAVATLVEAAQRLGDLVAAATVLVNKVDQYHAAQRLLLDVDTVLTAAADATSSPPVPAEPPVIRDQIAIDEVPA